MAARAGIPDGRGTAKRTVTKPTLIFMIISMVSTFLAAVLPLIPLYKSANFDYSTYTKGDSKYYKDDDDIVGKSIHKQFTYAKNIIQYSLNIFQKEERRRSIDEQKVINGLRYRDELTEGYNITPNFFIRGAIKEEYVKEGKLNITDSDLEPDPQEFQVNKHFLYN